MRYPLNSEPDGVTPSPSFPSVEDGILAFWKGDDTFRASIAQREGCDEWTFYDGPPFANGLPHYGHLLTGYAKDVFPRYQTMRGKQVHRRFGWDTHGLPAELEAMRQLGITEKHEIDAMGIDVFNAAAKRSVLQYTDEWQQYVTRQARWVDFEDDYKTLDVTYMESVLWAWKTLWDKDLAYEGFRVLPYCWNDQTPLSNHELRMDDDVYKMRQDQSVTVAFPLTGARAEELGLTGVRALAWTTTPWTLPTNAALAVGPAIAYAVLPAGPGGAADGGAAGSATYLLASDTVAAHAKDLGYASAEEAVDAVSRTIEGRELDGVTYERLFDFLSETEGMENGWKVLVAEYVETGEGTGIVHQAPAYGADDQEVCAAAGIPVVLSLDEGGLFTSQFGEVAGMLWSDANKPLTKAVRDAGRLLRQASYEHSYPHCWRCRKPLIYKAVSSWFVRVTEFRDRMGELNQDITWVPDNVKDGQFGKWVGNAIDWSVSRNRYFGTPIPVWVSDDPEYPRQDVYGSLEEIERDFGRLPRNAEGEVDLHRPFIDELTRPNPDDPTGRSTMRRITDVFDVWFDSGSMPYAQVHYPFENREWFDTHSPADFIVEYIGQTRGWFYVMHALSTALFDRPAFTNVISHGIVLGSDGQKMSKSLRNYPDVSEVFHRDGADAMRWFLMSSSVIRGGNLVVTEEGIRQGVREFLLPLWSTYYFFTLYANASGDQGYRATRSTASTDVLDRYLLAKTRVLVADVTTHLDALDTPLAAQAIRDFADVLTNWYVRRSRDKFWAGAESSPEARAAFDTLFTVLETLARVAAPLAPLVTEEVWKGLTGDRSVHLTDWPSADEFPADDALVAAMDRVRDVASKGLALRKATGKRVRLPLATLTLVVPDTAAVEPFADILRDELNVKRVVLEQQAEESLAQYGIERKLTVNARAAGPRIGKAVQQVIPAAKRGDWTATETGVTVGGVDLVEGEFTLDLTVADTSKAVAFLDGGGFVVLDTVTTPELEAEGIARDVVRAVQQARRDAGLDVGDRIVLTLRADETAAAAIGVHETLIANETLAGGVQVVPTTFGQDEDTVAVGDEAKVTVEVQRA
ncbi:isoleucine--tRNA ligase [Curtobacterium sp. MCJR17_055]|uniref:isoleucine--tRNA ligase n=1 Tax=unclassified Curtobacterium TaxID=257496 RepID=UPI000D9B02F8|nr:MULTISPECIES: isoleucine--tRNA ligase [unclassified Curtobacterium]PYY34577.1 isoleucine--tRNA ligase [Curtobacterium sp. MCBD17_029]PYY57607.1 isoleucine--tRNA ligase [Curtobacterium sp. MCPF17_015]PYY58265.1 isoleucine--tRNA ligase [Curtobacterium sp. MCJR17_055]